MGQSKTKMRRLKIRLWRTVESRTVDRLWRAASWRRTMDPLSCCQCSSPGMMSSIQRVPAGRREKKKKPDGYMNPPDDLCQVPNPEMLGDGNCDGGLYNIKECNWDGGDCCDKDCRPSFHKCGEKGYKCEGAREGVRVNENFKCDQGKVKEFEDYFDKKRDELTLGKAMVTAKCTQLKKEEHANVAQAFNLGVELAFSKKTKSAAAQRGGPYLFLDCDLWDDQMGNDWFGTLVSHEVGHLAGYRHPKFKNGMVYDSKCRPLGSKYCPGHCMEWTSACENHLIYGSSGCGTANTACKTTCVKTEYCFSLPERLTECFGFQKVHSRGESSKEILGNYLTKLEEKKHIAVPIIILTIVACGSCCFGIFQRHRKKKAAAAAGAAPPGEQPPSGEQPPWGEQGPPSEQPTWNEQGPAEANGETVQQDTEGSSGSAVARSSGSVMGRTGTEAAEAGNAEKNAEEEEEDEAY
mmetsp:Transcript_122422/g.225512  ORF Transcript_122422/g.225512 Transcript_122422/m.225512 type:complete len:465 (+) Transcript_122422:1267-2661(+)